MKKKNKWKIAGAALLGTAAILTAGYLFWCSTLEDQVIWQEVAINGVSLRGKSIKEAEKAIQKQFNKDYQDAVIKVTLAGETYETRIFPVLSLDASREIRQAYALGHGKWYERGLDRLKLQKLEPDSIEVLPEVTSPEKLTAAIKKTGITKVNTMTETTWKQEDTALTIYKGSSGVKADLSALEEMILQTLEDHGYEEVLACPETKVLPEETDLQPFYDEIHVEMKNAFLDKEKDYAVVPSVQGVSFDVKEAEKQLEKAEEGTEVKIPYTITEPELSTEELNSMLYRDVIGSYTTYGGGTSNRITNIKLACESCNNVILNPGEIFSYNETVGERTAARGFQSAIVIANGQAVQGIGGGICQVSTTIYAACLNAGLEIVERYPHSKPVSYVPSGMDATVSWGTLDYRFKNSTAYPLKLQVSYADGAITAELLGTLEN